MNTKTERNPKGAGKHTEYDEKYFLDQLWKYIAERNDVADLIPNNKGGMNRVFKVRLPTIDGFAYYLGVVRKTLYNWADRYDGAKKGLEIITQIQLQRLIDEGLGGNYNPAIVKLLLSHNHGIKEESVNEFKGEIKSTFDDQQLKRIAERIATRGRGNGDPSSETESD